MLYKLGRLLQFAGMIVLPVAIAGQAMDRMTLWQFLQLSGVGIGIFALGWLLQEMSRTP